LYHPSELTGDIIKYLFPLSSLFDVTFDDLILIGSYGLWEIGLNASFECKFFFTFIMAFLSLSLTAGIDIEGNHSPFENF
jgi:hypothetical protein